MIIIFNKNIIKSQKILNIKRILIIITKNSITNRILKPNLVKTTKRKNNTNIQKHTILNKINHKNIIRNRHKK